MTPRRIAEVLGGHLLPARWRAGIRFGPGLRAAAMATGVAELGAALVVLGARLGDRAAQIRAQLDVAMGELDAVNSPPSLEPGFATALATLLSPIGLLCAALAVEGCWRALGAAAGPDVRGLAVLWGLARGLDGAARGLSRASDRLRVGPLCADEVRGDAAALVVETCRRRGWAPGAVIEHLDALYALEAVETRASGPRPFVYRFRRLGPEALGAPLGPIHRYAPDELLPRRRAGLPDP